MKNIALFLALVLLAACTEDQIVIQPPANGAFANILSITYEDIRPTSPRTWTDTYEYDAEGALVRYNDLSNIPKHQVFHYTGDSQLQEILTFQTEENQLLFRDSLTYNHIGQIEQVHKFRIDPSQNASLTHIENFSYDNNGRLRHKSTTTPSSPNPSTTRYLWNGGNIRKVDYYSSTGELLYETSYTYDNQVNYRFNFPAYRTDPFNRNHNNVTRSSFTDHTGLIDPICFVCETQYEYNAQGLPIRIEQPGGRVLTIEYE